MTQTELKQAISDFDDFLNTPPEYEDQRMVRDFRHSAYARWRKVADAIAAVLSRTTTDDAVNTEPYLDGLIERLAMPLASMTHGDAEKMHNEAADMLCTLRSRIRSHLSRRPAGAAEAPSDMDYGNNMQIAVEKDGIRQLAAQAVRVETGPVQFGDDWPGVFIRGDNAFGYVGALDAVLRRVDDPMAHILIQSLRDVLSRSDLTGLSRASAQTAAPAPAEALTPPEFQEATWGIDSVMRPVRGMAVSEFAFREWAKENGIRLSASPTAPAAASGQPSDGGRDA